MDKQSLIAQTKNSVMAAKGGSIIQHVTMINDFLKEYNRSKEEIARINGQLDLLQKEIEYRYKLYGNTLDQIFDERRKNFNAIFSNIELAIKNGQSDVVISALGVIENLATTSPLKDLESFRKLITDGRTIEI
jgi:septation ring formation regulator EzrA